MSLTGLIVLVALELVAAMSIAWLAQWRTGNSGWVDVAWSFATGLAGVTFALVPLEGLAPTWRQWAVAALVAAWSLRLGLHIAGRAAHGIDDPRYAALRQEWGTAYPWRLYVFLLIQAAVAFGLAVSMALAARNPAPFGWLDALGILVLASGIAGEAAADADLRRFKSDPASHGQVCDRGLWAWSRHPNYFFEWLGWVAYPLFALAGGWAWGWIALSGPILMFWTLRYASGVPPLEAHMARRYGAAWTGYVARVPVFFPRPPSREPRA
jgi:steroid 5-alpha reductase family enzyme